MLEFDMLNGEFLDDEDMPGPAEVDRPVMVPQPQLMLLSVEEAEAERCWRC